MGLNRVLAMVDSEGKLDGCNCWRVFQPMSELNRQGFKNVGWDYLDNPLVTLIWKTYDAIVLPRLSWEPEDIDAENRWFNLMRSADKAVIYEVDDDLFSDDFVHRLVSTHDKTPERAETIREGIIRTIQRCDGVTVSSEYLRVIVADLTDKPIHVVPNFIDLRWFRQFRQNEKRQVKGLTIGWAGGVRPDADVEQMAISWGRIAERFPHVTFVLMGHQAQIIYDHVPEERIHAIKWMPVAEYPIGIMNIDIGCCPLSPMLFNRSKTYIKAMEYAALGAAVVTSPTVYTQLIEHGRDGYICETADEWERALAALVSSANIRQRLAQNLERKVEQHHSLEGNAWRWLSTWDDIIEDYRGRQTRVLLPEGVRYERRVQA